ncbi:MAG: acyl-CoA reductase [Bacteroidetes bacterium HGW-Bacteroidetes-17]|nr:MAG: acyl-CoA reductase [Bacteroidetes bacterium HGW-Bacteroidetes-17]
MDFSKTQTTFAKFGQFLAYYLNNDYQSIDSVKLEDYLGFKQACTKAFQSNAWFTEKNIDYALAQWAKILTAGNLKKWLDQYDTRIASDQRYNIGVVLAGNIPIVGFHDFICVLASGNNFIGKLSSADKYLLPAIAEILIRIEPLFKTRIKFTEERLSDFDAIIATGSNNSARYFEYYFAKYPHIIRKNRNGVAVLTGAEKRLDLLAEDILRYFGLGCRNVSKLYVPEGYKFDHLLSSTGQFDWLSNHHKYRNNYDYNKSILLVNRIKHFDNGLVLLREESSVSSPISVLHYEYYREIEKLNEVLDSQSEFIQCIISEDSNVNNSLFPGQSQQPDLWDYADGIDTMEFLLTLL